MRRVHSHRWSRLVRCLLVVAAWQAPLPFWHAHGTLANATAGNSSWLAKHLRTHHATIDPCSRLVFGWHLHFAFPEPGDEAPDAPRPTRQRCVMANGLAAWDGFIRLQTPLVSRVRHDAVIVSKVSPADRLRNTFRGAGFFTDFAPDMPLPVRLGVLRC